MKNELIKQAYISSMDIEDKALKDMIIITTKCLADDGNQRYVYVDNNRLRDELIYYRFYGEDINYDNILNILLPVIISNTNIDKSEQEVLELIKKYIKYLKKDTNIFEYIISTVIYNTVIHTILDDKNIEYKELLQKVKDRIIGFSINLEKIETIKFQMVRINALQYIDKYMNLEVEEMDTNNIIINLLDILYRIYIEDKETENKGVESIKKSILSILGQNIDHNIENIDFILSMSEYIVKLRNYKIKKKLYNQKSDPRYLINLQDEETVLDPILNQIKIVSKRFENNILNITVKSKSGIYQFKFKKS